jgi:DNA-directed RNA polymerase subunit RPC12/RpoP
MAEGRCMKCKKQVEIKDAKDVVMKNGMAAVSGVCPVCGTKVFRILGKSKK